MDNDKRDEKELLREKLKDEAKRDEVKEQLVKQEVKKDVLIEKREADPKRDPVQVEKAILMGRIQTILREYNGQESDIPTPHNEYWALLNRYRGL